MSRRGSPAVHSRAAAPDAERLRRGIQAFQAGRHAEAERILRKVLKRSPETPDALHILGLLAAQADRIDQAEEYLRRCVAVAPTYADAHNNLGNALMRRGRLAEAQAHYAEAARLAPRYPLPRYNLGHCLHAQGRLAEAELAYQEALALAPDYLEARINLGNVLREQECYEKAEATYREVLARDPSRQEVHLNLGNVYRLRGDLAQARVQYETLLQAMPGNGRARLSLALLALDEHDLEQARSLIEEVQRSGSAPLTEMLAARALLLARVGDRAAALADVSGALAAGADSPEYYSYLADLLADFDRRREAVEVLERCRERFGDRPRSLLGKLVSNQGYLCDWGQWQERVPALVARIRDGGGDAVPAFGALALPGLAPADLLAVAQAHGARYRFWAERGPLSAARPEPRAGDRLRIGYLSADLREHPSAWLSVNVFELHDRQGFETFAYAIGPPDDGPMRRRLRAAFDRFVELSDLSHLEAARRIAADRIDILVDLQGYTKHARTEILALRPAPVQTSWLGFPGTMGAPFIDYLVVDPRVVPPAEAACYSEALAYLPHCYQPQDPCRTVAPTPTRSAEGLPEQAFVFCCFNNPYKITPEVFGGWCALLAELPHTVLWLYASEEARANLKREAAARGLREGRIRFADTRPQPEHLARIALADLFLDTWPYNAHTTASDALWMGVPVLTCPGDTFPSRVAASLLTAAGLPELIATDPSDYLQRARRLAGDPTALAALREGLRRARATAPLFDARGFARDLEALYRRVWARHRAGLSPAELPPQGTIDGSNA